MKKFLFFLLTAFFCLTIKTFAQPQINTVKFLTPNTVSTSVSVPIYSKIELGLKMSNVINTDISTGAINPYDSASIDVYAILQDAQTNAVVKRVNGFYMIEYKTLAMSLGNSIETADNDPAHLPVQQWNWRIRLTVDEVKNYNLLVFVKLQTSNFAYNYPITLHISGQPNTASHGFLRFPNGHNYAQFTDGTPFFGVAVTAPPYNEQSMLSYQPHINNASNIVAGSLPSCKGPQDYPANTVFAMKDLTNTFAANGGNFMKYYFTPNAIDIEWCTLGKYDEYQHRAQDFDKIVENFEDKKVYLQLGAWTWEQFKNLPPPEGYMTVPYSWDYNPYKTIPGVTEPKDLFFDCSASNTNFIALGYLKRKLRYMMARWGYSPSIASIELMTELDNIKDIWTSTPAVCAYPMPVIAEKFAWLSDYIKQLSGRMLVTTGVAGFTAGGEFFTSPLCDYADFHLYNTDYFNGGCAEAYVAEYEKRSYHKPFHNGEFGVGSNGGMWWSCQANDNDPRVNFSNTLWSSAFSGSFTTAMHFGVFGDIFGPNWGIQVYKKFKPISVFFQGEDLNSEHYRSIKNRPSTGTHVGNYADCVLEPTMDCLGSSVGYKLCQQFLTYDINYDSINAPLTIFNTASPQSPIFLGQPFTPGIETSDDDNIEVYALRSEKKILGWVHNKTNYYYNLPHFTSGYPDPVVRYNFHPGYLLTNLNGQCDQTSTYVTPLSGATMKISGLNCVGMYKVEWYRTRGTTGGIIAGLTVNNIQPVNGSIIISIPAMVAYNPAFPDSLPDYGFKITMVENAGWSIASEWKNADLNANAHQINGTALAISNNNNIFYRGIDGDMHYYYYDEYCWANKPISVWTASEQIDPTSPIAAGDKVFYRNNIKFLEQLWFDQQTQTWIAYMHVNAPVVQAASDITMEGDKVFYSSFNNFLTVISWNGNSWVANELFNAPKVAVGSHIAVQNNQVFYSDQAGNLTQVYLSQQNQWIPYTHANAPKVRPGSPIRVENGDVTYIGINDFAVIMTFDQVQQLWIPVEISWGPKAAQGSDIDIEERKAHYRSVSGDMVQVYWAANISAWVPYSFGVNDVSSDSHIGLAPGLIFYKGTDNAMHMIYWSGTTWVPYTHPGTEVGTASPILIDQYGKIFYTDPHVDGGPLALGNNQVHVLWWDNPCVTHPPCTYANYRPGQPGDTAKSSFKLLQPEQSSVLKVYPNPSNDGIYNIVAPANTNLYIKVTNLAGQEILSKSINSTDKIDLGSFANGVYMLSIRADKEVVNFRLILDKK